MPELSFLLEAAYEDSDVSACQVYTRSREIRREKAIDRISRREFFAGGLKLAGLAGFRSLGLRRLRGPEVLRLDRKPQDRPSPGPSAPAGRRAGFFAVQTHFGQFRPDADGLLDLVDDAGIAWIRDEVYWSQVEKRKGVFDFPPEYDDYLAAAQDRGIHVLLILDFGNPLYSAAEKTGPASEAEREAFARYCAQVVRRYGPYGVRHFEIWNEPNASTFWKPQPNPENYARLLETAYRSCKDVDPDSVVLGCSTAGTDIEFIRRVLAAGGGRFMDAVSFHPYCQPAAPEDRLLADISRLKALVPEKPLWITEFGYPSYAGASGVNEEVQANYLVRAFLLAASSPAVERMFWYDLQNDGEDPAEGEFNFGLVRMDKTLKPSYRAFATMASLVGQFPPAQLRSIGDTHILTFEGQESPLAAVWRSGGTDVLGLPCSNGLYRVVGGDGESSSIEVYEEVLQLTVSEKPVFVIREGRA